MFSLNTSLAPSLPFKSFEDNQLKRFLEQLRSRGQGFYSCIDSQEIRDKREGQGYEDIVVLGIGGSALGPRAIDHALRPLIGDKTPHLHVVDNVDPVLIQELEAHIDLSKTLFVVITKSGRTSETLGQYFYFREKVDQAGLDPKEHFVFITDPEKGSLRRIAEKEGITSFEIPPNVGGRFSVLTPVGLLPASLMGLDIERLLEGAREVRDLFLSEDLDRNICYQLARLQHHWYEKCRSSVVLMPYIAHLKTFGEWYAQLLAESTGKMDGQGIHVGYTPLVATGVTDQHSQLQLYREGPDDKQFIFIVNKNIDQKNIIPIDSDDESVQFLSGVSFGQLLNTEYRATAQSLHELGRDSVTIEIDRLDEKTLGGLFMLFQGTVAFLGEFLGIDAFDQPGVERSKVLTREYLLGEDVGEES